MINFIVINIFASLYTFSLITNLIGTFNSKLLFNKIANDIVPSEAYVENHKAYVSLTSLSFLIQYYTIYPILLYYVFTGRLDIVIIAVLIRILLSIYSDFLDDCFDTDNCIKILTAKFKKIKILHAIDLVLIIVLLYFLSR